MKYFSYLFITVLINLIFTGINLISDDSYQIDSLQNLLNKNIQDSNKILIYLDIASIYTSKNPDSSQIYITKSKKNAYRINWNYGLGLSYAYQSKLFELNGNYNEAIKQLDTAILYMFKSKDSVRLWNYYTMLGNLYESTENYPKALVLHFKALQICKLINSDIGISSVYSNIGTVYSFLNQDSVALSYFFMALDINSKTDYNKGFGSIFNNIGIIHQRNQNFDSSLFYYQKSLSYNIKSNYEFGESMSLRNIGNVFLSMENLDSARIYLENSLSIERKINNIYGIAESYSILGVLHYYMTIDSLILKSINPKKLKKEKLFNTKKSISYLHNSVSIFNELGAKSSTIGIYRILSDIYYEKKIIDSSYYYFRKYAELKDSLYLEENSLKIANLESKILVEKKELEIEKQKLENNKIKDSKSFQFYIFAIGIVILIVSLALAFIRYTEKKKLSDQLARQKSEIESKNSLLEIKNTEIMDSINYAATIQNALLPWTSVLANNFNEHFVIYMPKDIVSGDSYWFQDVDGIKYLAVIDCTGHGVPGSMLTVIANSVLDDAVLSKKLTSTSEILTYMNEKVTEVLNQRLAENSIRDGMEVALIAINQDKIQFSGAGRPLFIKNGKLVTFKTDKRGIAGQNDNDIYNYSSVEIEKTGKLMLYLTSDGFADQMNENSKKFSTKRLVSLLDSISEKSLGEQQEILEKEFNSHKGNREQIDDVTILGVRI